MRVRERRDFPATELRDELGSVSGALPRLICVAPTASLFVGRLMHFATAKHTASVRLGRRRWRRAEFVATATAASGSRILSAGGRSHQGAAGIATAEALRRRDGRESAPESPFCPVPFNLINLYSTRIPTMTTKLGARGNITAIRKSLGSIGP